MDISKQTLFGFYGSLRKGEYNYEALMAGRDGVKYNKTAKITGFRLYSLGAYPVILPSSEPNPVIIDVFSVENPMIKRRIDGMEIGAGYKRQLVDVEGEEVLIYVGEDHYQRYINEDKFIPDGDWLNRHNTRKPLNGKE